MERFDLLAKEWDGNIVRVENAKNISKAIQNKIELNSKMKIADYGTGSGLIALNFVDFVESVVAYDSSVEMLKVLNEKSKSIKNIITKHHNIETDELLSNEFDLVISAMMLHHLKEPKIFIDKAFESLKNGGFLAVADLRSEDGSFHSDLNGVYHFGFSEEYLLELTKAFVNVEIFTVNEIKKDSKSYPIFLLLARK